MLLLTDYEETERIGPQPGPQEEFLSTPADIAIYGGAAGGGKTYALLLEPCRHLDNPDFGAVIFRREAIQVTSEGGLFDTSLKIYMNIDGVPKLTPYRMWTFPSQATITFSHLHNEYNVNDWQGSQIPLICYDELTHFTEQQFWYMLSRNRSTCGVRPYVRATCNPDADSWVANFIEWWIDQDTGFPIPDRSGVLRYFIKLDDKIVWGSSRQELLNKFSRAQPKSVTFIPSRLTDNKILMERDPDYLANLMALGRVERERLLNGNWKIRPQAGSYFPRTKVSVISEVPNDVRAWIRRWDLAATEPSEANPSPSATASVLMGKRDNGRYVIADGINIRENASEVRETIKNIASQDRAQYKTVVTIVPQDPGQAGKDQASNLISFLASYVVKSIRETGSKEKRAEPLSVQWQAGNVEVVSGPWNKDYFSEMEGFPEADHDDYVDASSGAFLACVTGANVIDRWRALSS